MKIPPIHNLFTLIPLTLTISTLNVFEYFEDRSQLLLPNNLVFHNFNTQHWLNLLTGRLIVYRIGWKQLFNIDVIIG
jgi:hypothetical protein